LSRYTEAGREIASNGAPDSQSGGANDQCHPEFELEVLVLSTLEVPDFAADVAVELAKYSGVEPVSLLIVDSNSQSRHLLSEMLGVQGYAVATAENSRAAIHQIETRRPHLIILDLSVPDVGGPSLLQFVRSGHRDIPVIVTGSADSVEPVVAALRSGAFDFLVKPLQADELMGTIERALEGTSHHRDMAALGQQARETGLGAIVGNSPPMQEMYKLIRRVAPLNATVLITGETGTGKELVARAIHDLSSRRVKPFIPVQCSSLASSLLESELFGHVKGSFTGAIANRRGCFEEAHGGTLFLDEIGTVGLDTQVKLLRVLQERAIQRVGTLETVPVDFRLICASNVDLMEEVAAGRFREDLFFRLDVFPIAVPPLRERRTDIPLLAATFLSRFSREHQVPVPALTSATLTRMMDYDWPGNVRELENHLERALIMQAGRKQFVFEYPRRSSRGETLILEKARQQSWTLAKLNKEYTLSVLERTRGRQSEAAALLGISRRTLHRKLQEYSRLAM
jgi:DNA-binding NtrC family response regulator